MEDGSTFGPFSPHGHRLPGDRLDSAAATQPSLGLQVIVGARNPVTGMGNSSSDRSSGVQGGQQVGKEPRANILMDGGEDGDVFQREDAKVDTHGRVRAHTHIHTCTVFEDAMGLATC